MTITNTKQFYGIARTSVVEQLHRTGVIYFQQFNGPQFSESTATGSINRTKNPNWKTQIQKRQNASTYYRRMGYEYIFSAACWFEYESKDKRNDWARLRNGFQTGLSPIILPYQTDQTTDDQALWKIKRRLASEAGQVSAMAPIAEINDLRRTIKSTVALTTGFFEALLTIKRTKGRSALKYASEAWLTWNFGMSPLIRDTKDILKSIDSYLNRQDLSTRLYGSQALEGQVMIPYGEQYDGIEFGGRCVYHLSYKYIGAFDLFLKSAESYSIEGHLGLDLPNVIPTAWELLPFSWAVDYFINMGNFLDDTFSSPPGSTKYLVKCRKYRAEIEQFARLSKAVSQNNIVTHWTSKPGGALYIDFERSPLASLPHIGIRFRTVDEMGKYGISKLLNLVSIVGKNDAYVPPLPRDDARRLRETAKNRQRNLDVALRLTSGNHTPWG